MNFDIETVHNLLILATKENDELKAENAKLKKKCKDLSDSIHKNLKY